MGQLRVAQSGSSRFGVAIFGYNSTIGFPGIHNTSNIPSYLLSLLLPVIGWYVPLISPLYPMNLTFRCTSHYFTPFCHLAAALHWVMSISLKSLISPPHLHAFLGLKSKIKSKKTSHQQLEVPEKDGDYFVSPLIPHCTDVDTSHLAFDVMLKTGVKISCKISLSLLNDYISH